MACYHRSGLRGRCWLSYLRTSTPEAFKFTAAAQHVELLRYRPKHSAFDDSLVDRAHDINGSLDSAGAGLKGSWAVPANSIHITDIVVSESGDVRLDLTVTVMWRLTHSMGGLQGADPLALSVVIPQIGDTSGFTIVTRAIATVGFPHVEGAHIPPRRPLLDSTLVKQRGDAPEGA
jgi:hypothetical protein